MRSHAVSCGSVFFNLKIFSKNSKIYFRLKLAHNYSVEHALCAVITESERNDEKRPFSTQSAIFARWTRFCTLNVTFARYVCIWHANRDFERKAWFLYAKRDNARKAWLLLAKCPIMDLCRCSWDCHNWNIPLLQTKRRFNPRRKMGRKRYIKRRNYHFLRAITTLLSCSFTSFHRYIHTSITS